MLLKSSYILLLGYISLFAFNLSDTIFTKVHGCQNRNTFIANSYASTLGYLIAGSSMCNTLPDYQGMTVHLDPNGGLIDWSTLPLQRSKIRKFVPKTGGGYFGTLLLQNRDENLALFDNNGQYQTHKYIPYVNLIVQARQIASGDIFLVGRNDSTSGSITNTVSTYALYSIGLDSQWTRRSFESGQAFPEFVEQFSNGNIAVIYNQKVLNASGSDLLDSVGVDIISPSDGSIIQRRKIKCPGTALSHVEYAAISNDGLLDVVSFCYYPPETRYFNWRTRIGSNGAIVEEKELPYKTTGDYLTTPQDGLIQLGKRIDYATSTTLLTLRFIDNQFNLIDSSSYLFDHIIGLRGFFITSDTTLDLITTYRFYFPPDYTSPYDKIGFYKFRISDRPSDAEPPPKLGRKIHMADSNNFFDIRGCFLPSQAGNPQVYRFKCRLGAISVTKQNR